MGHDENASAYLEQTRHLANQLVHADDPYDTGLQFMGATLDVLTTHEHAGSIYLLWSALTDWVELRPHEEALAMRHMVTAAREWLQLDLHDGDAVRRYFQHWLYEVLGYDRR